MKSFGTILKFELANYFKSKSYIISTLLICLVCAVIMFVPRFINTDKSSKNDKEVSGSADNEENKDGKDDEVTYMALYDAGGIVDMELLKGYFGETEFKICDSEDAVKSLVASEEAEAGYVVKAYDDYDYYVFNRGMFDENTEIFTEVMEMSAKKKYCEVNNLDKDEFLALEYLQVNVNENVLGKDSVSNYFYCYILIILVFMIIVMYGTTIATGVTNEKSNRSIEILVTSTSSTALLFGKVFAGAIATVFQVGLIGGSLLGSYQVNKSYWSFDIGQFLNIPSNVVIAFAIFGIGGFLFYAFMYGALGALVSKIEDLNKSAGTAQMLVMIVYFITLIQLSNIDGVAMKVCSFLPFSSYSAMFARVAMGNVATWEVVLSAVILYASVVVMGIIGGKIFRASTLRYGNPIKLTTALKGLKKSE